MYMCHCHYLVSNFSHIMQNCIVRYGNFLILRPYHGEHGPDLMITPEYITLQWVPDQESLRNVSYILRRISHIKIQQIEGKDGPKSQTNLLLKSSFDTSIEVAI
jgi:hypothetical protein